MKKQVLRLLCMFMLLTASVAAWAQRDDFNGTRLDSMWQHLGKVDSTRYVLDDGRLRLYGDVHELCETPPTTFIGLPLQQDMSFTFSTKLVCFDSEDGDEAGLVLFRATTGYVQLCLNNYRGDHRLKVRLQLLGRRFLLIDRSVGMMRQVWLRAELSKTGRHYNFLYSTDGKKYHWLESVEVALLSPVTLDCNAPLQAGLYAYSGNVKYQSGYCYADFDFAELNPKP